jgi:hypothetical protein
VQLDPLRLIANRIRHLARAASTRTSRLVAVGSLTALLAAASLLLSARAAIVVVPLLAAVIVGLAASLAVGNQDRVGDV